MIIKGGWKLLRDDRRDITLLYRIDSDREEKNECAEQNPDIVTELLSDIREWEQGLKEPSWPSILDFRYRASDGTIYYFSI